MGAGQGAAADYCYLSHPHLLVFQELIFQDLVTSEGYCAPLWLQRGFVSTRGCKELEIHLH